MAAALAKVVLRSNYAPHPWQILSVNLLVQIFDGETRVRSILRIASRGPGAPSNIFLHKHKDVVLSSASVAGASVSASPAEGGVDLPAPASGAGESFDVITESVIIPEKNTELEGLYKSSEGLYTTQCEAEGFRAITPFIDRPDNMSLFTVRVEASRSTCPVLLSNGNELEKGDLPDGRHFSTWVDPFPKPSCESSPCLFSIPRAQLLNHTLLSHTPRRPVCSRCG